MGCDCLKPGVRKPAPLDPSIRARPSGTRAPTASATALSHRDALPAAPDTSAEPARKHGPRRQG